MVYYHVYIQFLDSQDKSQSLYAFDNTEEGAEKIATSFMKNKDFIFLGTVIQPSRIRQILVFKSFLPSADITLSNQKTIAEQKNVRYIWESFLRGKVKGVVFCKDFVDAPPSGSETLEVPEKSIGKKEKVFIVHGRDKEQALMLQKYLRDKLNVDAVMFDDIPDKSRTIIEQLEYIRNNVFHAFVIATPDDLGCLLDDMDITATMAMWGKENVPVKEVDSILETLKNRARQNVVFELGLFIGALGRDKVCCLLQKDVDEPPNDISGILYKPFAESVSEIFHEIENELKED